MAQEDGTRSMAQEEWSLTDLNVNNRGKIEPVFFHK
jgi:hypothetical protein